VGKKARRKIVKRMGMMRRGMKMGVLRRRAVTQMFLINK
jgi:hypothetical protein